jgi:hypothetical protein
MALAKHRITGRTVDVPAHYLGHPVLGKNLIAIGAEAQAAPKKETKIKEQPAPEVKVEMPKPEITIKKHEDLEDGN